MSKEINPGIYFNSLEHNYAGKLLPKCKLKNKTEKEVDLDNLLTGNFAIIYEGNIKKYLNKKFINLFKKLNTSLININDYSFKNAEFREIVKSGNIIVRPDLFIFGVTDSENNLQEISSQLFEILRLN